MHTPRRRFGQNFLIDQNVIHQIVRAINPKTEQFLVEIGPGQGALTLPVLQQTRQLTVIELDKDLIQPLQKKLASVGELQIFSGDALAFDFCDLFKNNKKLRVFGNLPYNISTPLIFHLLNQAVCIEDMTFMLQLEVVKRICAQPGTKDYGRLSVMVQYHCQVEQLFDVPSEAFFPKPKVISAIVVLRPYENRPSITNNYQRFSDIVRIAFNQRRKTLANTLRGFVSAEQLNALSIDPSLRPEMLSVTDFVKIANL